MPAYDYVCLACKKPFSLTLSFAEHDRKRLKCPKCSSTRVQQSITQFFTQTTKKS